MQLIRGLHSLRPEHRGSAATLGNFDGLHRGHQALLALAADCAREQDAVRTVVTFEPLPAEYFRGRRAPVRLMSLREKLSTLMAFGVERVLLLRFNRELAEMPAETFVDRVLVDGLGARAVVIGDDYRFGHQRRGDAALLRRLGDTRGFVVRQLDTVRAEGQRSSSSAIRSALAAGDPGLAATMLGRPYTVSGRVTHGRGLGRDLGAATANFALRRRGVLRHGVYCVRAGGHPAVANFGVRPSVEEAGMELLEVHILDGEHTLYGKRIDVQILHFLRPEQRFDDLDALRAAIAADIEQARRYFEQQAGDGA